MITGANAGIGLETAKVLAARGATVVIGCRDVAKGEHAAAQMHPADVRVVRLDLTSLASVGEAADAIRSEFARLDLLINNAGVMAQPRGVTENGFESTLATNHLGHFALTGRLLEHLLATPGSRIVTVSSNAHRRGTIDFEDLQLEARYDPGAAYDRSKLANLLFAYQLQRRLEASGASTISLAAHPGNASTALWRTSSPLERVLISPRLRVLNFWLAQTPSRAALPSLLAAVDPAARGGEYYGPSGRLQYSGNPVRVESSPTSHDADAQRRLWVVSEQLTRVTYRFAA